MRSVTHPRRRKFILIFLVSWCSSSLALFAYYLSQHVSLQLPHDELVDLSIFGKYQKRIKDDFATTFTGRAASSFPGINHGIVHNLDTLKDDNVPKNRDETPRKANEEANNVDSPREPILLNTYNSSNKNSPGNNSSKRAGEPPRLWKKIMNTHNETNNAQIASKQIHVIANEVTKLKNKIMKKLQPSAKKKKPPRRKPVGRVGSVKAVNISVYRHDSQYLNYMECPTTPRRKMSSSKFSRGKYTPDVPILLTPEHVTQSEFKRLKRYRDLTGWKSNTFEGISKTMSLLNSSLNRYLFDNRLINGSFHHRGDCVRCAIVGNGGILNGSKMGQEIDSHDYVFRTNVAITNGHEVDVGSKTSFYCFGMKTLSNSVYYFKNKGFPAPPWNPDIRYVFLPEDDWAYRYIHAALTNNTLPKGENERYAKREPFLFPKPLKANNIKIIHPDFCRYVDNSWLRSQKLKTTGRATTGAIMIFLALHTCDEVNAFGFMGDPKKYTSHYYDTKFTRSDLSSVAWHDWEKENQLWESLIDEGILHMYTRD